MSDIMRAFAPQNESTPRLQLVAADFPRLHGQAQASRRASYPCNSEELLRAASLQNETAPEKLLNRFSVKNARKDPKNDPKRDRKTF